MDDDPDLLRPSLRHADAALPAPGDRPWRPGSTAVVGFFGGPFAATWYALDNLKRLGALDGDEARRVRLYGYSAAAIFLVVQVGLILYEPETYRDGTDRSVRLLGRMVGYGIGYLLSNLQAGPARRWAARVGGSEASFDSAWWPGFIRAFGYGLLAAIPAILVLVGLFL